MQGIHPRRQALPLPGEPGPVELVVEAASNPILVQFRPTPLGSPATAGTDPLYRLERAELVVVDVDAEALLHDLDVLDGVMRELPVDDPRRARIRVADRAGPRRRWPRRRAAATTRPSRRGPPSPTHSPSRRGYGGRDSCLI